MSCQGIVDPVQGYQAGVDPNGRMLVSPRPKVTATSFNGASVGTTTTSLVGALTDRARIRIMNLDPANAVHLRLGTDAATTNHMRLGPGESLEVADYEGAIQAIAVGAAVQVACFELKYPAA